jgi:hypothetical protein
VLLYMDELHEVWPEHPLRLHREWPAYDPNLFHQGPARYDQLDLNFKPEGEAGTVEDHVRLDGLFRPTVKAYINSPTAGFDLVMVRGGGPGIVLWTATAGGAQLRLEPHRESAVPNYRTAYFTVHCKPAGLDEPVPDGHSKVMMHDRKA